MPTFPSRIRFEPILDISQDITNPAPDVTALMQNVEVFDNHIKLYFGFMLYFSLFQALWKIEIAFRIVLFWQDTEEPITPSSSPSPVPVLPPTISISPAATEATLPTSPTTSYYEADEGTARDTAPRPMDITPSPDSSDRPLSPITAHRAPITVSSDNAPQTRAVELTPSAPLYSEAEQLRRDLALSYPSSLVSALELTSDPSIRHPLLRSPSPTSNSPLFSNQEEHREQCLEYFTQAHLDRAWLPPRYILADDFHVRATIIFSRPASYTTFLKLARSAAPYPNHADYERHLFNLMIDYLIHQKSLPETKSLAQWIELTNLVIRIENQTHEPAARPSLIRMLFDAQLPTVMPSGVRSAELDMLDRSAPEATLGVPMLPATSRLDLDLPVFDSQTFPSLDPVTLALCLDVLDLDSLGLDLDSHTTCGAHETITIFWSHFMDCLSHGIPLLAGTNIIRPYQEILDFLKCTAEVIIYIRGPAEDYITWDYETTPILYIRMLSLVFGVPRFLWQIYSISADFCNLSITEPSSNPPLYSSPLPQLPPLDNPVYTTNLR